MTEEKRRKAGGTEGMERKEGTEGKKKMEK